MNKAEKSAHAHNEIMCLWLQYMSLVNDTQTDWFTGKQNVHTSACNNCDEIEGEMAPKITYNYELKLFK